MKSRRTILISILVLLLLAAGTMAAAAMDDEGEVTATSSLNVVIIPIPAPPAYASGDLSGDAAYDPAAGGAPEQSVLIATASDNQLASMGDFRRGAGEGIGQAVAFGGFSGDDEYDPAAGSTPERSVLMATVGDNQLASMGDFRRDASNVFVQAVSFGGYSGDDIYDPAAGGTPERSVLMATAGDNQFASFGGYSGDDDYDPAAGGRPELAFAVAALFEQPELILGGFHSDEALDSDAEGSAAVV